MVTLSASRLFCQLSLAELEALSRIAAERRYPAGEEIFKEGDVGDGIFVVKEGSVEISGSVNKETRRVIARLEAGDFFGEMAVLEYRTRSGSARAATDTTAYFIPRLEIVNFIERSPVLAMTLLKEISNRQREFNQVFLTEVVAAERLSAVGRFAQSILHDIKNPLNVIGLSAELTAMESRTSAKGRQSMQVIGKQVVRISELIAEVLEFTRGGPSKLDLAPVEYGKFVRQVAGELSAEAALRGLQVQIESVLTSASVQMDARKLERVFHNLFYNALDFVPEDGGRIGIRVFERGREVVTEVEDNGPGIAPEIAGRLFEPFATHGKAHGTGLGLSICKRIVEDHRGWIRAQSQPGSGAMFVFGLPIWQGARRPAGLASSGGGTGI